jgi:2-C-methyl-D-erythritol 4-phosphate cytidylyltransferase
MKTVAIIVAAGSGKRMGKPKQFLEIGGKPMLEWTLAAFEKTRGIDGIILVVNEEDLERAKKFKLSKLKKVIPGGKKRKDSVYEGLKAVPPSAEIVAIHDGARPFISSAIIEAAVAEARVSGAAVVGIPVTDTIKRVDSVNLKVESSLDRQGLWAAQTPQVFKKDIILRAYEQGWEKQEVTDDAMLVEKMRMPLKMVMGSPLNIKITRPEELRIAAGILSKGA